MIVSVNITDEKKIITADAWEEKTFRDLDLQECHIEEFLRNNIDLICGDDESMLVIGQQVENAERGRSDLTAVDGKGRLVLIEIKRDKKDIQMKNEPMDIQAIRYAASYASIKTLDEVVEKVYTPYITKHSNEYTLGDYTVFEYGKKSLTNFLTENNALNAFNNKQRIILVASEFDKQTLSSASWLIANHVDISCIEITPMMYGNQVHLNIEKILPVSNLSDFYVDIAVKNTGTKSNSNDGPKGTKTVLPKMDKLMNWGIIKAGDTVWIKNHPEEKATVISSTLVNYKGNVLRFNQWAQGITGWSSICIYEWLYVNDEQELLHTKRMRYMEEHPEEMQ